jgi:lipopolysaccharide/colanic/teichoic acid biosynthesis glycosyltransferase
MRLFDLLFATIGMIVFAPVFVLVTFLILLDDGGPVFFRQERLGRLKVHIHVLKFRTMRDGEVTSVGRILRKTGLDEIPQFFNVLVGNMSMVGPRPLTLEDVARLRWDTEDAADRWGVKPGITGLAQIYGGHSARASLFLDRAFIQRQSVCLGICVILISYVMNIFGKRRVRQLLR